MRKITEIENIDEMRRCQGIDDVELHEAIRELGVGDVVKLTFLDSDNPSAHETLLVRITSRSGSVFRGKLADTPRSPLRCKLNAGSRIIFTAAHVHSVHKDATP
jgi:hypothetical protein